MNSQAGSNGMTNILVAGDIVGKPGRTIFARVATRLRAEGKADVVVANAENAAGGNGLTPVLAAELFAGGADVLTLGDHSWDQRDIIPFLATEPRVVRPANYAPGAPGRGWYTFTAAGATITVVNLLGRVFMPSPYDCPFRAMDDLLKARATLGAILLVDFHAEATSEKIAMGHYLAGKASAVFGTHTHVQTSDEAILAEYTGYITDLGMTGPKDSVLGREKAAVLRRFITGLPEKFEVATGQVAFEGILLQVDPRNGACRKIKRLREFAPPPETAAHGS